MRNIALPIILTLIHTLVFQPHRAQGQERKMVEIRQANSMRNLRIGGEEIRRLIGDVIIVHEDVVMYCDSAYEYSRSNRFDAFSNVVITQENRKLYGDVLYYDGNTGNGRVRGDLVRMVELDEQATLITQFLDFNTTNKTGYFYNGGILFDKDNRLSSENGFYESDSKRFIFSKDVALLSPDALINTDSLEYFSDTKIALYHGPTCIFHDDGFLYSEKGWYNEVDSQVMAWNDAYLLHDNYMIFGDTVFYDTKAGFARANNHVTIIDTTNRTNIYGNLATYWEVNEAVEVTIDPLATMITDQSDTLFIRADVLKSYLLLRDSLQIDTTQPADTTYRVIQGVGGVRLFRHDFQGLCDSLTFSSIDSILRFYVDPILWNEENQISADRIYLQFRNEKIHRMNLFESAFLCSHEEKEYFNQIKGRDMEFQFSDGELYRLNVIGSGEMIYFLRDKGEIVAVNKAESSSINIHLHDGEVYSVTFNSKPVSTIIPIQKTEIEDVLIRGFTWYHEVRPQSKLDIIPENIELDRYKEVLLKANRYSMQKILPAESLELRERRKEIR